MFQEKSISWVPKSCLRNVLLSGIQDAQLISNHDKENRSPSWCLFLSFPKTLPFLGWLNYLCTITSSAQRKSGFRSFSHPFPKHHLSLCSFIFSLSFTYMYVCICVHTCMRVFTSCLGTLLAPFYLLLWILGRMIRIGVELWMKYSTSRATPGEGRVRHAVWYSGCSNGVFWCWIVDGHPGLQTESWSLLYYVVLIAATLYYRCYQFEKYFHSIFFILIYAEVFQE